MKFFEGSILLFRMRASLNAFIEAAQLTPNDFYEIPADRYLRVGSTNKSEAAVLKAENIPEMGSVFMLDDFWRQSYGWSWHSSNISEEYQDGTRDTVTTTGGERRTLKLDARVGTSNPVPIEMPHYGMKAIQLSRDVEIKEDYIVDIDNRLDAMEEKINSFSVDTSNLVTHDNIQALKSDIDAKIATVQEQIKNDDLSLSTLSQAILSVTTQIEQLSGMLTAVANELPQSFSAIDNKCSTLATNLSLVDEQIKKLSSSTSEIVKDTNSIHLLVRSASSVAPGYPLISGEHLKLSNESQVFIKQFESGSLKITCYVLLNGKYYLLDMDRKLAFTPADDITTIYINGFRLPIQSLDDYLATLEVPSYDEYITLLTTESN